DGERRSESRVVSSGPPGDHEDTNPEQVLREVRRSKQSDEVWERLGLPRSERRCLQSYFGINPEGAALGIEEIARRGGKRVQTVRPPRDRALCLRAVPAPAGGGKGGADGGQVVTGPPAPPGP